MKKVTILILSLFLIAGCNIITNFEDCVNAGNPILEIYPRQCKAGGRTFVEETCKDMSLSEAKAIARKECGMLKKTHICNEITNTWWIDLEVMKNNCNPACVVDVETKKAEINWRCTGAIEWGSRK